MDLYFAPDFADTQALDAAESQHCVRVMRRQAGDAVTVTDGRGKIYKCVIEEANAKHALLRTLETIEMPPFWQKPIHIAVAPTKHMDRMEWLVEKVTEIGVDSFTPLLCRWSERKEIKPERLEKIAVAAMKQSQRAVLPQIKGMTPFSRFLEQTNDVPQKFIAHCVKDAPRVLLSHAYLPELPAVIAIGPEGDFAPEEIEAALRAGFQPVSLGEARLRTETAALVACDTCHIVKQLAE